MDDRDKITEAVKRCIAYILKGDHPIRRAADFVGLLRVDDWTETELGEVRSRALVEWARRRATAFHLLPTKPA
jgi:hypothetical protein